MQGFQRKMLSIVVIWFVCGGVDSFLLGSTDSCLNRCNTGLQSGDDFTCQCNQQCERFNDCCSDYQTLCTASAADSCQGRCHDAAVSSSHSCQCNSHCVQFNDCCSDYNIMCVDTTPASGTCKSMSEMGQVLWDNDVNRMTASDVTTNFQSKISDGTSTDNASNRLFSQVDESKFTTPTYSAFLNLLDNYYPYQTSTEHGSSHETAEINTFLDAVLSTKVMAELQDFLICQSKVTSKADFKSKLQKIWFDYFKRSYKYAYDSTSGFEHILVGEYKDSTTVSGFHSWLSFYQKEKAGAINYLGYVSKMTHPPVVGAAFTWSGHLKTKGTFFVGTSPEFDTAVYTLCYLMHPDSVCQLTIDGHSLSVQTYDSQGHIATAFIR